MIHHSASSQPRPAGRGIPRIRRWAAGLAVAAIASLAGAPSALAGILPPPGGAVTDPVPPPPPPAPAAAHLPLWAVVTIVAATIVLSVGTTLVTLSLEHRRRARRTPASAPGAQPGAPTRPATAEPPAEQGEILSSHQHLAGYDMHRTDSR
ncbi:MAG TPA: hypothetical protein VE464_15765 [Streptosporangiaceae bacterium]|jgi:hypothetical protein|nr:hypothetical protein [Streptosporangiaceae bacterium]